MVKVIEWNLIWCFMVFINMYILLKLVFILIIFFNDFFNKGLELLDVFLVGFCIVFILMKLVFVVYGGNLF